MRPSVGARVIVAVGSRSVTGIVVGLSTAGDVTGTEIKSIRSVLDADPFLPSDVVDLARWTAAYYGAGVGATITAVLPPKTRGERADAHKTRRIAMLTAAGMETVQSGTASQREAMAIIGGSAAGVAVSELTSRGLSADVVARLARLGLVSFRHERIDRDPFDASTSAIAS